MKKELIVKLTKDFEEAARMEQDVEYWMARDIQHLFEYKEWDNFLNVIEKAKIACANSKLLINSHFREVTKMVRLT
jgi:DNA-damage-inducible protein D